jgi:hypothetical protein
VSDEVLLGRHPELEVVLERLDVRVPDRPMIRLADGPDLQPGRQREVGDRRGEDAQHEVVVPDRRVPVVSKKLGDARDAAARPAAQEVGQVNRTAGTLRYGRARPPLRPEKEGRADPPPAVLRTNDDLQPAFSRQVTRASPTIRPSISTSTPSRAGSNPGVSRHSWSRCSAVGM